MQEKYYLQALSLLLHAVPILYCLCFLSLLLKFRFFKWLSSITVLASGLSLLGIIILKYPFNLIFSTFFILPYLFTMLDGFSVAKEKNWAVTLKTIAYMHIAIVLGLIILLNILGLANMQGLKFLPERMLIMLVGIFFLLAVYAQSMQRSNKACIYKIISGLNLLFCWIYFSKVTFSQKTFLFDFSF